MIELIKTHTVNYHIRDKIIDCSKVLANNKIYDHSERTPKNETVKEEMTGRERMERREKNESCYKINERYAEEQRERHNGNIIDSHTSSEMGGYCNLDIPNNIFNNCVETYHEYPGGLVDLNKLQKEMEEYENRRNPLSNRPPEIYNDEENPNIKQEQNIIINLVDDSEYYNFQKKEKTKQKTKPKQIKNKFKGFSIVESDYNFQKTPKQIKNKFKGFSIVESDNQKKEIKIVEEIKIVDKKTIENLEHYRLLFHDNIYFLIFLVLLYFIA
jgi:hypothetical protein